MYSDDHDLQTLYNAFNAKLTTLHSLAGRRDCLDMYDRIREEMDCIYYHIMRKCGQV